MTVGPAFLPCVVRVVADPRPGPRGPFIGRGGPVALPIQPTSETA